MMTSTIKVPSPRDQDRCGDRWPGAREAPPEPVVPRASSEPDLESRIKQRRLELIGKLCEIPSEASLEVVQTGDRLKAKLSELAHILSLVDGWSNLGDAVEHQLERWLAESERSLSSHDVPTTNGES